MHAILNVGVETGTVLGEGSDAIGESLDVQQVHDGDVHAHGGAGGLDDLGDFVVVLDDLLELLDGVLLDDVLAVHDGASAADVFVLLGNEFVELWEVVRVPASEFVRKSMSFVKLRLSCTIHGFACRTC